MSFNPYAYAMLEKSFSDADRRRAAIGSGQQDVGSTSQALSGARGVGSAVDTNPYDAEYKIPDRQAPPSGVQGMAGGAAAGGQAGGIYGAIIGAALAKQRENKDRMKALDNEQLGYQGSFAAKLGYPGEELEAKQKAKELKYNPQENMFGIEEPKWLRGGVFSLESIVHPGGPLGAYGSNKLKQWFKLPL